ncbi:MAG TPA: hypothetical protein VGK19_04595 [Capsulimonadaceae bacterium]|jgi:DNA-binding helix-hairpin-helix protein with protein kinase domain
MPTLYSRNRGAFSLGKKVGGGGEGDVFAVTGSTGHVAKRYHAGQATKERQTKLEVMVGNPPDDPCSRLGHTSIAWPLDLIYLDPAVHIFDGFVMPRIDGARPLADAYHVPTRRRSMPGFTWQYLLCAGRNLASAVQALHDKGYVVGDMNESNVFIYPTGLVTLIDTDSFQVPGPTGVFRCPVGKPEYLPPERQGSNLNSVNRTSSDDHFALAVLIFLLLMEGRHPFDGVPTGVPDEPEIEQRIARNWFRQAYGPHCGAVLPPPSCPPWAILPAQLQSLFVRCFVEGENLPDRRPSAIEWTEGLDRVMASLQSCSTNSCHSYSAHLRSCPWCERSATLGIADPFPSHKSAATVTTQTVKTQVGRTPATTPPMRNLATTAARTHHITAITSRVAAANVVTTGKLLTVGAPVQKSISIASGNHVTAASSAGAGSGVPKAGAILPSHTSVAGPSISAAKGVRASQPISSGKQCP